MKKLLVTFAALSLFVASCGDDDATTTTAAPAVPTTAAPTTTTTVGALELDVVLADFTITPDNVEAVAGAELTANVSNDGGIPHTWTVLAAGTTVTTADEISDDLIVASTENLAAGDSQTLNFTVPAAGSYQIVCRVPGHIQAGMVATLDVSG